MSLIAARAALTGGKKLPYDAEVEYLESTGTQWIDTGVSVVNSLVGTIIDFQATTATSSTHDQWVFGMYNNAAGNGLNYIVGIYGGWCVALYNTFYKPNLSGDKARHIVKINIDGKTTFDNITLLNSTVQKTDGRTYNFNAFLFASHRSGTGGAYATNRLQAKIFSCKMYSNGVLVRNFIPVRFTNELGVSEGAMYDRANPTVGMNPDGSPRTDGLYRNRGTGAFLWAEKQ